MNFTIWKKKKGEMKITAKIFNLRVTRGKRTNPLIRFGNSKQANLNTVQTLES